MKEARKKRDAAKRLLADGIDPSLQRQLDRQAAAGNTFKAVAEELLAKLEREGLAPVTLAKKRWLLEFAFPMLGERPIAQITAPEILLVLRRLEGRGRKRRSRASFTTSLGK